MRPGYSLFRFPVLALFAMSLAAGSSAQTVSPPTAKFTKLADFGNGNGEYPNSPLAQGLDGGVDFPNSQGLCPSSLPQSRRFSQNQREMLRRVAPRANSDTEGITDGVGSKNVA